MSGFAQWYVRFLGDLWNNICEWFYGDVANLPARKMTLAPGAYLKRVGLK